MRNYISRLAAFSLASTSLVAAGCFPGARVDVHDNNTTVTDTTVDAQVDSDTDADHVHEGGDIHITVTAQNIYLVDPDATPPPEHASDAGHFQFYLDSMETPAIKKTAETHVTISVTTLPGPHKIYCRVHKHDGTPTSAVTVINITVVVNT